MEGSKVVPSWIPYLCLFCAALLASLATTPLARHIAVRVGAVDYPSARRINKKPIPRMGGIAIFCGIVAAFAVQYVGTMSWGWPVVLVPSPKLDVNYGALYEKRYPILRLAAQRLLAAQPADYTAFLTENRTWLPDYAAFMALKDARGGRPWWEWEEGLRLRHA